MSFVRYDLHDRVAVLTIDNPPVNALAQGVWEAVEEGVARAVADPGANAMVLIGAGSTFVAGADAEQHFRLADLCILRGDPEVARLSELQPAPERVAVNGRHERLGGILDALEERVGLR